ncbi:uncharacterized protein G2W53_013407 [Senna tora]|uniref:Uncharacterized protein n=1 Tax=Senna tora TaxID=362788 RepID=A0A834U4H5_9FABA|nr:uncharacterized protein G2W53_013407 [Senna tora]
MFNLKGKKKYESVKAKVFEDEDELSRAETSPFQYTVYELNGRRLKCM